MSILSHEITNKNAYLYEKIISLPSKSVRITSLPLEINYEFFSVSLILFFSPSLRGTASIFAYKPC